MKNENYEDLMDKFFAGKASAEEMDILKGVGLPSDQEMLYEEALRLEREQKMDWDFEDFLKEIPATKAAAVPLPRIWMKRMMAAAAVVTIVLLAYVFWPPENNPGQVAHVPAVKRSPGNNNNIPASPVSPVNKAKEPELSFKDSKTDPGAFTNNPVKTRKQNRLKSNKETSKDEEKDIVTNKQFEVMVNGKPITDEADAVAIMKESLSMVSSNLTHTVNELKPIAQIKIKL